MNFVLGIVMHASYNEAANDIASTCESEGEGQYPTNSKFKHAWRRLEIPHTLPQLHRYR